MVITRSEPNRLSQLECTEQTLSELGCTGKPTLYVFNKCDKGTYDNPVIGKVSEREFTAYISAKTGQGCENLASILENIIHMGKQRVKFVIPNSEAGALSKLYANATVEEVEYGAESMTVYAVVDAKVRGMMKKYDVDLVVTKEDWE